MMRPGLDMRLSDVDLGYVYSPAPVPIFCPNALPKALPENGSPIACLGTINAVNQ